MHTQATTIGNAAQIAADQIFDAVFERSLHFAIELDFDQASRFIRRIDRYNDFQWAHVLDALEEIDRLIPRRTYGAGNPHNGERDYTLRIGRDGSPVLYLDRLEFGDRERMTDERMQAICSEMELIGQADEAEVSVKPTGLLSGRRITFRFWWD
jgi:hypothetical protein